MTEKNPHLVRGLSTTAATSANIIDMVGVGPFITLPLIVTAMGGPQAMLGWILGALLSLCDGCVWSELGTAYPEAGGSYAYLKNIYGKNGAGKVFAFLYAWQLLLSAPLSIASGCIGFAQYVTWFVPSASKPILSGSLFHAPIIFSGQTLIAMSACGIALIALYRPVAHVGRIARVTGAIVIATLVGVILVGFTHFSPSMAFSFPASAFHLDSAFFYGLGAGLLVSAYDYWGYYNACFLGAEVEKPEKTIPRAVLGSIVIVGTLYVLMNISVLGVLPWKSMMALTHDDSARQYTMAAFVQTAFASHAWAHSAASIVVVLIATASLASVFGLLLGYSRIPFAAALDGNFPAVFGKVHARYHIPAVSLFTLGAIAMLLCLLRLQEVIASLVIIRIVFQFLMQGVAVMTPKHREERRKQGRFRMPLYPLPAVLAMVGFLFILFSRKNFGAELKLAGMVAVTGLVVYFLRSRVASRA
ncbi:APC family permease [Terriglobus tenax]|uniref:APC family permease n=1 Tax=Terriglobus tenax TaxID=1111115 RepID=UPI0021DF9086|nr:APC family permease [Terriglobus tenax]